jgi:hypothetical protein
MTRIFTFQKKHVKKACNAVHTLALAAVDGNLAAAVYAIHQRSIKRQTVGTEKMASGVQTEYSR